MFYYKLWLDFLKLFLYKNVSETQTYKTCLFIPCMFLFLNGFKAKGLNMYSTTFIMQTFSKFRVNKSANGLAPSSICIDSELICYSQI